MKFGQSAEINKMYVCNKFRGSRLSDFDFRAQKPSRKFGIEDGRTQKRLKYSKKYFTWLYVSRCPFIPTNPLLTFVIVVAYIYPPVTRQRQTLNIERSAHFSLQ